MTGNLQSNYHDEFPRIPNRNSLIPTKNPWWVKAIPHICLCCILINVLCYQVSPMQILMLAMYMFFGSMIQKDRLIIYGMTKMWLLLLLFMNVDRTYPIVIWAGRYVMTHYLSKFF